MTDYAELNDTAKQTLDALRAEGIVPTDADVVRINALAWDVESPRVRRALARGTPVRCGNRTLWPLTVAAAEWYRSEGCRFAAPRTALAYAMANGRDESLGAASEADVRAWTRGTRATDAELDEAMSQVLQQGKESPMPPPRGKRDRDGMTHAELAAHLHAVAGGSAKQWERSVSVDYCLDFWSILSAQNRADGRTPYDAARDRAIVALGWCEEQIRERARARGESIDG
jgi:hypothetical protein